jgi:sulfur carrier protein ThiS
VIRSESCQIILAGKRLTLPVRWSLNGSKTAPDQIIKDGDRLEVSRIRTLGELLDTCDLPRDGYVYRANGDEVAPEYILKHGDRIDYLPEEEIKGERFICIKVNSEEVKLPYRDEPYIFVDVFNFVDFDLSRAKGKVELAINGTRARYTDIIREGDEISIYWTKV